MSVGFHVYDGLLSRAIYNHDFSVRCDLARMFANANQNNVGMNQNETRSKYSTFCTNEIK